MKIGIINYLKKDFIKLELLNENYKFENMARNTTYCFKTNSKSNFNSKRVDDISKFNIVTKLELKCKEKE